MMMLDTSKMAYQVYETFNYEQFSFIDSNRAIKKHHVNNLIQQINEGYELPPIIVKGNGEILDGQHRFEAFKELELPIRFIVRENVQQDMLQKSNSVVSTWTIKDHVRFHANEGNLDYQKLLEFMAYSELSVAMAATVLGKVRGTKSQNKGIVQGTFYVTSESDAYAFVDDVLMRIRAEKPTTKMLNGIRTVYNAGIDTKQLVTVVNALEEELMLISKTSKIVERIVTLYNKQCNPKDRIKVKTNKQGHMVLA